MFKFSLDAESADKELEAIIFYLTTFGYVDGDFCDSEREFVREYIKEAVNQRIGSASIVDEAERQQQFEEMLAEFYGLLEDIDAYVGDLVGEALTGGDNQQDYVLMRLKVRCFEMMQRLDLENQREVMTVGDAFIEADGVVHPAEVRFRSEMQAVVDSDIPSFRRSSRAGRAASARPSEPRAPAETRLDDSSARVQTLPASSTGLSGVSQVAPASAEPVKVAVVSEPDPVFEMSGPVTLPIVMRDHPFLSRLEVHYASDPVIQNSQAEWDHLQVRNLLARLREQRARGEYRLRNVANVTKLPQDEAFLDKQVYVIPSRLFKNLELIVIGDLHGSYSCLKAALVQSDFLRKVEAYRANPQHNSMVKLIFLGDYLDRGRFGFNGVLRTVIQLYLTFPEHVCLLRGNHEYYLDNEKGAIKSGVHPAESILEMSAIMPNEYFRPYKELFDELPSVVLLGQLLFVHGGIPRDECFKEPWSSLEQLSDPKVSYEMLWSDPSTANQIPVEMQQRSSRFTFGWLQFKSFMDMLGSRVMIRGHEKVAEGFKEVYNYEGYQLYTLFSCGGLNNEDFSWTSTYRRVRPMALTINITNGRAIAAPWAIRWEPFNTPGQNGFYRHAAPTGYRV